MNKLLLYLVIILVVPSVFGFEPALDCDFIYDINVSSDFPFFTSEVVTVSGAVNTSVNLTDDDYLFIAPSINLYNSSSLDIMVNVSVPNLSVNHSGLDLISVLVADSWDGTANVTSNFTFCFLMFNDSIEENKSPFIRIGLSAYEISVCDYQMPMNYSKSVIVSGDDGDFISVVCEHPWLNCSNFTVPVSNWTDNVISISVPEGVGAGKEVLIAEYWNQNESSNFTVLVDVRSCIPPPPSYTRCQEVCNKVRLALYWGIENYSITQEEYFECLECEAEYEVDLNERLIKSFNETVMWKTEYQNVTTEVRVPVLDLDDDNQAFLLKISQLAEMDELNSQRIQELFTELEGMNGREENRTFLLNDMINRLPVMVQKTMEDTILKNIELESERDKLVKKTSVWAGGVLAVLVLLGWFVYVRLKDDEIM